VINFHNWPIERAQGYEDCFPLVEQRVKSERVKHNRKIRRERWWQFAERAPSLYRAIADLDRVLIIALLSKAGLSEWVPTGKFSRTCWASSRCTHSGDL
jgi:hypothetical protein